MYKLIIGDTEFELEHYLTMQSSLSNSTPYVSIGNAIYVGKAIPNTPKEKPKSYEVLEVTSHGGEVRKLIDGLYRIFEDGVGFQLDYILKMKDAMIKKVKRLSDGEVFTIGDKVRIGH